MSPDPQNARDDDGCEFKHDIAIFLCMLAHHFPQESWSYDQGIADNNGAILNALSGDMQRHFWFILGDEVILNVGAPRIQFSVHYTDPDAVPGIMRRLIAAHKTFEG